MHSNTKENKHTSYHNTAKLAPREIYSNFKRHALKRGKVSDQQSKLLAQELEIEKNKLKPNRIKKNNKEQKLLKLKTGKQFRKFLNYILMYIKQII